jgi:alpha-methylacyl-CoA racemase
LAGEDLPDQHDRDHWPELRARFAGLIGAESLEHWLLVFAGSEACVTPVHSLTGAVDDAHLRARGTYFEASGLSQPSPAPRFSRTPASTDGRPARPGADTAGLLAELGYDEADISKLLRDAVAQAEE